MKKLIFLLLLILYLPAQKNTPSVEISINLMGEEFQGGYLIFKPLNKEHFAMGAGVGRYVFRYSTEPEFSAYLMDFPLLAEVTYLRGEHFFSSLTGGILPYYLLKYKVGERVYEKGDLAYGRLGGGVFFGSNFGYKILEKVNLLVGISFFAPVFPAERVPLGISSDYRLEPSAFGLRLGVEYIWER